MDPAWVGIGIYGLVSSAALFSLLIHQYHASTLADRRFGAQATIDEPLRRSIRAKIAVNGLIFVTSILEMPLFASYLDKGNSWTKFSGFGSILGSWTLVVYDGGNASSWMQWGIACNMVALSGYPLVLVVVIGMWAEVVRNVPGTLRQSLSSRDRGSLEATRHTGSTASRCLRCQASEELPGTRRSEDRDDNCCMVCLGEEGSPLFGTARDVWCCGTRPLQGKPGLLFIIAAYVVLDW